MKRLKRQAELSNTSINALCSEFLQRALSPKFQSNAWAEKLQAHYGDKLLGLALFGSVARGTERESSDIDLLIVLSDARPIESKLYREWDDAFDDKIFKNVSPHFVHIAKDSRNVGSLWLEVAIEGKVLFDPQSIVETHLRGIRSLIAEGHFSRSVFQGVPYWKKVS
jgi:predicted nucleotidyltransferase